jgi:hypothetical protein
MTTREPLLPFEEGLANSQAAEAEHLRWLARRMAKIASLGGKARAATMTRPERRAAARHAARVRWAMHRATRGM